MCLCIVQSVLFHPIEKPHAPPGCILALRSLPGTGTRQSERTSSARSPSGFPRCSRGHCSVLGPLLLTIGSHAMSPGIPIGLGVARSSAAVGDP